MRRVFVAILLCAAFLSIGGACGGYGGGGGQGSPAPSYGY